MSYANGAREEDLLGCAETVNQATGACVAAAAACGFITSKRRHCVNGAGGMLLTQMQQTLTDGRNAGAGFGNTESRRAALPAVRFLLLPHSSADPVAVAIFFPFQALS